MNDADSVNPDEPSWPDSLELYGHTIEGIAFLLHRIADRLSVGESAKTPEALAAARLLVATGRALAAGKSKEMSNAATSLNRATKSADTLEHLDEPAGRVLTAHVDNELQRHNLNTKEGRATAASEILVSLLFTAHRIGAGRLFPNRLPAEPVTGKIIRLLEGGLDEHTARRIVRECSRQAGLDAEKVDKAYPKPREK